MTAGLFLTKNMQYAFLRLSPHTQTIAAALTPHPGALCAPPLGESFAGCELLWLGVHLCTRHARPLWHPGLCAAGLGHSCSPSQMSPNTPMDSPPPNQGFAQAVPHAT